VYSGQRGRTLFGNFAKKRCKGKKGRGLAREKSPQSSVERKRKELAEPIKTPERGAVVKTVVTQSKRKEKKPTDGENLFTVAGE